MVRLVILRWKNLRGAAIPGDVASIFQDTTDAASVATWNPTYQTQFDVLYDEVMFLDQYHPTKAISIKRKIPMKAR
jgi:hypothetical protein